MTTNDEFLFEAFLNQHDEVSWAEVVSALRASIHEVDKTATPIWFAFYPLALHRALQQEEDPSQLAREWRLFGKYELKDQVDTSHAFLYGHRYWPEVKQAVIEAASGKPPSSLELAAVILDVARNISQRIRVPESLLVGITAVAFMTLQQAGMGAFKHSPGRVSIDAKFIARTPEQVLRTRARDDFQGMFGFLRGVRKEYTVTFNENQDHAKFKLIWQQELASAAATDKRDYRTRDARCIIGEGPIPVECRAASCGSCWVGILGGAEKLSEIAPLEAKRLKEFGYWDCSASQPIIRLACQAQATGAVSIVIPPWNGVFGKHLRTLKAAGPETRKESSR